MKPIDVELYQFGKCLACKTNRVPKESWGDERNGYHIILWGSGTSTTLHGENKLRLGTSGRDHDCKFYPTESEAEAAYGAYTAMIDEYNREHEEPEKKDAFAPAFGERWIKDGFVWEACESAKRNEHTCSICDYDKHCGEMVCKACMYVKKIGPAYTPCVFTDCAPGRGSLHGPERKTRIAKIYDDPIYHAPVVDSPNMKRFAIWDVVMAPNFAGYEVRFPDGTKHTVAAPFVFVNDDGECSIESTDEYRHKSTLMGVAFLEDSSD